MAYTKKIWVDVPDPSNLPDIPEGQDSLARFDAKNMNRIEEGIENSVKKTGDIIEGDLQIYTNSPSLILNNKNQNHSSIYKNASSDQNIDFGTVIRDSAENIESGNYLGIVLRHGLTKDGNLSDAFKLHLRKDGVEHGYKIYGEHNKPTSADVGAVSKLRNLNGRDILNVNEEGLYYCINTINMPTTSPSGYLRVEYADENYKVIYWRAYNSHNEYVNVLDNGEWLGWVETLHSNHPDIIKTEIKTYKGTGTYGKDNPNLVTFSFVPSAVCISAKKLSGLYAPLVWFYGEPYGMFMYRGPYDNEADMHCADLTWNGKELSWYNHGSAYQFNEAGETYQIIAWKQEVRI